MTTLWATWSTQRDPHIITELLKTSRRPLSTAPESFAEPESGTTSLVPSLGSATASVLIRAVAWPPLSHSGEES